MCWNTSFCSTQQYIGCAAYPNVTTNGYTGIECKAHSVAGSNFWCYLLNPNPAMLSAVYSANASELSFLQLGSDSKNHCTSVTATNLNDGSVTAKMIVASLERVTQRRDALQPIDFLIARGPWGVEELIGFHEKLGVLDPQQTELAMQKLAKAVNSGSVEDVILSAN